MAEQISESEAAVLLTYIFDALRRRELGRTADHLAAAASSRVVAEVDDRRLDHLPRSVRGELSTKSVREKSQVEQLMTVVAILDALLRQAPSVAAATAAGLDVLVDNIRFAPDETAIEMSIAQFEEEFRLTELAWDATDAPIAMNALAVLWNGVGRETAPQKSREGVWSL